MGYFGTAMHIRNTDQSEAIKALRLILMQYGFRDVTTIKMGPKGVNALPKHNGPVHIVAARHGLWTCIQPLNIVRESGMLELFYRTAAFHGHTNETNENESIREPGLIELAEELSDVLTTHVFSMAVADSDVMWYALHCAETLEDRYESDPGYYVKDPLRPDQIEKLRHHSEKLTPILPVGVTIEQVSEILDNGWWRTYNSGPEKLCSKKRYALAEDRMADLGKLLQLNGSDGGYPYCAWYDCAWAKCEMKWTECKALLWF